MQFCGEMFDAAMLIDVFFLVRGQHEKLLVLAVCFQVDSCHDPVIEQKRQDVVTPFAFAGRNVNLNAIVKIEESLGTRPEPNYRVEG